eukprot:gb/GECG01001909.1/.p1 GENE.gb/GECG01001909.1/~~gb/GECG01001909.1/.p1  ORF type:complete len:110 (+),score=5.31 gb/GECG01001909.1/:1-330(+)
MQTCARADLLFVPTPTISQSRASICVGFPVTSVGIDAAAAIASVSVLCSSFDVSLSLFWMEEAPIFRASLNQFDIFSFGSFAAQTSYSISRQKKSRIEATSVERSSLHI